MASVKKLLRSFARGEVTPQLFGRVDLDQFQTGLALCRNWLTRPHGVCDNRPGTSFVSLTKNGAVISRLVSFSFNNTQTFAIELGVGYFRFYTQGARLLYGTPAAYNGGTSYLVGDLVTSGGNVYYCITPCAGVTPPNASYWYLQPSSGQLEVPNAYTAADLFDVHYVQSNDTMTFTHPNYPPSELKRLSAGSYTPIQPQVEFERKRSGCGGKPALRVSKPVAIRLPAGPVEGRARAGGGSLGDSIGRWHLAAYIGPYASSPYVWGGLDVRVDHLGNP